MNVLAVPCGVLGAVLMSQFPAFSDAYLQRLAGQNDALRAVVEAFDASAENAGLTREAALADLSGSPFQKAHQADLRQTITRADQVAQDLALLRAASPFERMAFPHRYRDPETLSATWADFQPAVPASIDGIAAAGTGFLLGYVVFALLWSVLMMPFRRRRGV